MGVQGVGRYRYPKQKPKGFRPIEYLAHYFDPIGTNSDVLSPVVDQAVEWNKKEFTVGDNDELFVYGQIRQLGEEIPVELLGSVIPGARFLKFRRRSAKTWANPFLAREQARGETSSGCILNLAKGSYEVVSAPADKVLCTNTIE